MWYLNLAQNLDFIQALSVREVVRSNKLALGGHQRAAEADKEPKTFWCHLDKNG
jgi:hypothetical protein